MWRGTGWTEPACVTITLQLCLHDTILVCASVEAAGECFTASSDHISRVLHCPSRAANRLVLQSLWSCTEKPRPDFASLSSRGRVERWGRA